MSLFVYSFYQTLIEVVYKENILIEDAKPMVGLLNHLVKNFKDFEIPLDANL